MCPLNDLWHISGSILIPDLPGGRPNPVPIRDRGIVFTPWLVFPRYKCFDREGPREFDKDRAVSVNNRLLPTLSVVGTLLLSTYGINNSGCLWWFLGAILERREVEIILFTFFDFLPCGRGRLRIFEKETFLREHTKVCWYVIFTNGERRSRPCDNLSVRLFHFLCPNTD